MAKIQFRVLYRQFLFRMVDVDLLSADAKGDQSKLFGQFTSLLIFLSLGLVILAFGVAGANLKPAAQLIVTWSAEHFLIATTMLVVALFAVLSWDSTFPDKRDVVVLVPLPVRTRTIFLAKIAAVATALSITVIALHLAAGLIWPIALNTGSGGLLSVARSYVVYWLIMFAAGAFIFCCVLGVQGIAAQLLPRQHFLRASSFLQLAAFGLFVTVYFLEPKIVAPGRVIKWSPTYWFLGLFQQLNGSPALAPLAKRAWMGLAAAFSTTAGVYSISYLRTMRKIAEAPDIVSRSRRASWLPGFGNGFATAVGQFSIRTVLRSRQHRLLFAFYLGIGFAAAILFPKWPAMRELAGESRPGGVSLPVLGTTILLMALSVLATRIAFSLPVDLRSNWIFRIVPVPQGSACLLVRRGAFYAISVIPVWVGSTVLSFWIWPWQTAAKHLVVLALLGMVFAELGLSGIQKIPFACSYLPGKSNFHITFLLSTIAVLTLIAKAVQFESRAFEDTRSYAGIVATLAIVGILVWWRNVRFAKSFEGEVQFEQHADPAIFTLNLPRDSADRVETVT
ncbi:MAG TPA: hypothetical protein VFB14_28075 [Bryobacteraceae bacterium]|jgi:hypothetical protein|nr:hypothetical protein [Bryobacteraceae bacterium]